MKHQMNKISGYYEGPGGVFYNAKFNEIFELEYEGGKIVRIVKKKAVTVGKFYRQKLEHGVSYAKVCVTGMQSCIRLGDL